MKIVAPFLLCLGFLPLLNCLNYDLQKRARLRREVPYVRTTRRASLHELLKLNGNIASVANSDETPEGQRQVHNPLTTIDRSDNPLTTIDRSDNRRVLVVGDGDEPMNYVDDDKVTSDTKFDNYETKTNDQNKQIEYSTKKILGATVTNYMNPFSPSAAPSYADPELLIAVMNQADEANFRFPGDHSPSQYQRDSSVYSAREKSPVTSKPEEANYINPYKKLFPAAFHGLLDIPMHVYRNGSAKVVSQKKPENKLQAPKITRGYSSTNINSPSSSSKENESTKIEFSVKRTPPATNVNYKPAVRRTSAIPGTTTSSSQTTVFPQQYSQSGNRQKPVYTVVGRKPNVNGVEDRIPPLDSLSLTEKKLDRPSLQFRGRTPALMIPTSTEPPTIQREEFYTETASPDLSYAAASNKQQIRNDDGIPNRFNDHAALDATPFQPTSSKSKFKVIKGTPEIQLKNLKSEESDFGSKVPPAIVKNKEQTYEPVEIIPRREPVYKSADTIREESAYKSADTIREESAYKPSDAIRRIKPTYESVAAIRSEKPIEKPKETININEPISRPEFNPQQNVMTKLAFKPSKVDPYLRSGITVPSYLEQPRDTDEPTTFKPEYHPFENQYPGTRQHNNAYSFHDTQGTRKNIVYNLYDTQGLSTNNAYNVYDTQEHSNNAYNVNDRRGIKMSLENINSEQLRPHVKTSWLQEGSLSTEFPFARHPTVDKHTFEQTYQPGAFSSFLQKDMSLNRADEVYSDLNGSLRPPPTYNSESFSPLERRQFNTPQQKRRTSRPQRKRPSLLKNFGFFKRRSGTTGPSLDINSLQYADTEKEASKYLLTKGPIPHNAQKVTVIGPFKSPPIGAPKVFPHHIPVPGDSLLPTIPSTKLIPPSPFKSPVLMNEIESTERGPSFKVINLPREEGFNINQSYSIPVQVDKEIVQGQRIISDRNGERSSIVYERDTSNRHKFIRSNSTTVEVNSAFHAGSNENDRIEAISPGFFPAQLEQVSDADKERIIAAKFILPRVEAVRRSGFDSHVIPIPVPLLSTSGEQVHQMQRIILPKLPAKRNILLEPHRKNPRQVYTAPISTHNTPIHNRRTVPGELFYNSPHAVSSSNSDSITPSQVQESHSKISDIKASDANLTDKANIKEDFANVESQNKNLEILEEKILVANSPMENVPMSITRPASSFIVQDKRHEEPQSFLEPTHSTVLYGGWKAVGESKVDPKGSLDPVVSFVIENTPEILLKSPEKENSDTEMESDHINSDLKQTVATQEDEPAKSAEIILGQNPEAKTVKYSSNLNIEGSDDAIKSFLVPSPKVL